MYDSTNGTEWANHSNWLNGPVKGWFGITVGGTRVTIIDLHNNNLNGTLPSSLGNIINLRFLKLWNNDLSGTIPTELGNLSNLSNLDLHQNHLTGSIPSSIGNLNNLTILGLHLNQLSGNIPREIGSLINLQLLWLNSNQLTGSIPSEIGNLTVLTDLRFLNNQLSGSIPHEFGNLINLFALSLSNNHLTESIPLELGNLKKLINLYLNNNQLSGEIPPELGHLVNLTVLWLNNNQLRGSIPAELDNLINIYSLNLSFNQFTFDGLELPVQKINGLMYVPQAYIPLHQNNSALSVSAGGTLSNNTYEWFMVGQAEPTTITGDSVFTPTQNGQYYAAVTNSICTQLTLYTDTIDYSTLPVTMINLKAYQQGSIIKVGWTSLTEINVAQYEIQRSSNANAFTAIGSMPAKGNSNNKQIILSMICNRCRGIIITG
ncbi:hypothetical protein BH10BAC2_BH10BAC2_18410 [soil metagenome]